MKRILVLFLALLFTANTALAAGFFPDPTAQSAVADTIPSYETLTGKAPFSETELPDGSVCQRYNNVSVDDYYTFGDSLGECGFGLIGYNQTDDGTMVLSVGKGDVILTVEYSAPTHVLSVSYPSGTPVPKPLSADAVNKFFGDNGYTEFHIGEQLNVAGDGKYTVTEVGLPSTLAGIQAKTTVSLDSHFRFNYIRTANSKIEWGAHEYSTAYYNHIGNWKLVFITSDGVYTYSQAFTGSASLKASRVEVQYSKNYYEYFTCEPMQQISAVGGFTGVPALLKNSTEGTVFLWLKSGSTNYVLFLRKDGVNLI